MVPSAKSEEIMLVTRSVWLELPMIGKTMVILIFCIVFIFAIFLLQEVSLWVGRQIDNSHLSLGAAFSTIIDRKSRTKMSRKDRRLPSNIAEEKAIVSARAKLGPPSPTRFKRSLVFEEKMLKNQNNVLSQLNHPAMLFNSNRSRRYELELELARVRCRMKSAGLESLIDYESYYLDL